MLHNFIQTAEEHVDSKSQDNIRLVGKSLVYAQIIGQAVPNLGEPFGETLVDWALQI